MRVLEENEIKARGSTFPFEDLRESLVAINLSPRGRPREIYFHPDHMSSAEKLNFELQKVRDEFKMSESDCGSARVRVSESDVRWSCRRKVSDASTAANA